MFLENQVCGEIQRIKISTLPAVRLGSNAQVICRFQGHDLDLQHVTWTKEFVGGGSQFVYSYDACARENRGYGALKDRAVLDIAKPSDAGNGGKLQTGSVTLTILVRQHMPRQKQLPYIYIYVVFLGVFMQ